MNKRLALLISVAALALGFMVGHATESAALGTITFGVAAFAAIAGTRSYAFGTQPAGTYQDGILVFGSQAVTISTVAYIADNIDFDKSAKVLTRNNEFGVAVAEVMIDEVATGSCTLQLSAATPSVPAIGATLPIVDVDGTTTINFKISKVGRAFKSGEETKLNVEFRKKLN